MTHPLLPAALALVAALSAGGDQDDASARAAWKRLSRPERAEVVARFEAEVGGMDTRQQRLVTRALALEPADPGWAEALPEDGPAPYYDPQVHAPDLVIERRRLKPSGSAVKRARRQLFARTPERRLRLVYRYDWGSGELRRSGDPSDPELVFENALAGYPPGAGLAEALCERALDDGSQRAALAAFGHAYTDREGGVYPFTIYEAWGSGAEIEMPDIDNLGIVHDLLDDWSRWSSPVPEEQQDALYAVVGELYEEAHRYRSLRSALARSYATGAADLRDGFERRAHQLHALWLRAEERPARAASLLPEPAEAEFFVADWGLEVEEDEPLRDAALARAEELARDGSAVRALMVGLVREGSAAAEPGAEEGD